MLVPKAMLRLGPYRPKWYMLLSGAMVMPGLPGLQWEAMSVFTILLHLGSILMSVACVTYRNHV